MVFSWVLVHRVLSVPPRPCFPVPCKFWRLSGGVNGDLLQEGSCRTQVCCTQNPRPCGRPLLTHLCLHRRHPSTDLSLRGVSGSWCAQGMFEPSERFWCVWDLILNPISPLLLSCWGFSFALVHGVSLQSRSSTAQPLFQGLPSCWGFSALGSGHISDGI